jgi:hypothetical protein
MSTPVPTPEWGPLPGPQRGPMWQWDDRPPRRQDPRPPTTDQPEGVGDKVDHRGDHRGLPLNAGLEISNFPEGSWARH